MTPRRFITMALALVAIWAFSSSAFATSATAATAPLSPATVGAGDLSFLRAVLSFLLPGLVPPGASDFGSAAPIEGAAPSTPTTQGDDTPQGGQDNTTPWPTLRGWDLPSWGDLLPKP